MLFLTNILVNRRDTKNPNNKLNNPIIAINPPFMFISIPLTYKLSILGRTIKKIIVVRINANKKTKDYFDFAYIKYLLYT